MSEPKKSCRHCYGRGFVGSKDKPMRCICTYSTEEKKLNATKNLKGFYNPATANTSSSYYKKLKGTQQKFGGKHKRGRHKYMGRVVWIQEHFKMKELNLDKRPLHEKEDNLLTNNERRRLKIYRNIEKKIRLEKRLS